MHLTFTISEKKRQKAISACILNKYRVKVDYKKKSTTLNIFSLLGKFVYLSIYQRTYTYISFTCLFP